MVSHGFFSFHLVGDCFSFTRSFLRATSHSFCDTTLRFSIPRTVLIFGMTLDVLASSLFASSVLRRGRIEFVFRNCRVHLVPRLGVRNKEIHLRTKPTWIIKTARGDSDESGGRSSGSPPVSREPHSAQNPRLCLPPAALGVKW